MLGRIRNWISGTRPSEHEPTDAPSRGIFSHEIIPGILEVSVYEHTFDAVDGPVHCWTYVSRGFARGRQPEIVLSIERAAESFHDCTRPVLDLIEHVYREACEGHVVGLGHITAVPEDGPGLLADERLRGIAYVPSEPLTDIPLPSPSITALLLTQNELDAARQFGLVRVMALLGYRDRHFPTATWVAHGRPDVTSPEAMSTSILTRTSWVRLSNCRAYVRGIEIERESLTPTGQLDNDKVRFARREVVLEVGAREAEAFSQMLAKRGETSPVALLLCPDPEADSSMLWLPDGGETTAIGVQGGTALRMAGNHVILVPGQNHDRVTTVEDGFALLVTNTTWREIVDVLARPPQNWGMPFSDGIGFRVKVQ